MGEATEIRKTLDRIVDCLERIEKTLPGYNQEALREAVDYWDLRSGRTGPA